MGAIVSSLRNRLTKLEESDEKAIIVVRELERGINREMDHFKDQIGRDISNLSLKLAADYVTRREFSELRTEITSHIQSSKTEMLEFLLRIETKLDKKADK